MTPRQVIDETTKATSTKIIIITSFEIAIKIIWNL